MTEHIDSPALTGQRATHEIWHPPRSAYVDEDADNGPVGDMYSALNAEVEGLETRQVSLGVSSHPAACVSASGVRS